MVETVVISREGMNISISVHNKDTARFVKQIKTPGQLLYAAAETGRVIPFGSFSGRDHVRTLGASAPFINPKYNPDSVLSIRELNARQEDSRESARNYILEKLRAAGIEVVTDKDAFDAALKKARETGSPVQKMAQGVLPEELFATQTAGGLEEAVRSLSKGDVNLQDEYIDIAERTPAIFQRLGLADLPVRMYRQKLARALFLRGEKFGDRVTHGHKDEYTEKEVMEVFRALADPRYVFRSKHSVPGGSPDLVAVYDVFDRDGNPMMISLRCNKNRKEVEANWVTSIYGKRKDVLVEDWAGNGYLIYMNDMGMEKASAEVVTLHMRVSKSAEAFKSSGEVVTLQWRVSKSPEPRDSILLKSRLVNGHDVSCMKKDGEIYGFADISQPGGKISHITEGLALIHPVEYLLCPVSRKSE